MQSLPKDLLAHSVPLSVIDGGKEVESLRLRSVNITEFMQMELPPRETVLDPVLKVGGLAMVYAPRGIGKTFFSLSLAYAIASGGEFLRWKAGQPRNVLIVDGEMPAAIMKERIACIARGSDADI